MNTTTVSSTVLFGGLVVVAFTFGALVGSLFWFNWYLNGGTMPAIEQIANKEWGG